jgi:hypothetical protein
MTSLTGTLVVLAASCLSGLWLAKWQRQDRIERLRDRARLQVIEAQMAALRAALRIQATEHFARKQMQRLYNTDPFGSSSNSD